jgi:hypothetical protein
MKQHQVLYCMDAITLIELAYVDERSFYISCSVT